MIFQLLIRLCYFLYFYNTLKYLTFFPPCLTLIYNHIYIIYLNIYFVKENCLHFNTFFFSFFFSEFTKLVQGKYTYYLTFFCLPYINIQSYYYYYYYYY